MTWGVPLSVSYHFAFSYCSWGSQGKNTEVACHSLLQWTTFCQTSPPWAWLSFIELDKAVVLVWLDWLAFCEYGFSVSALWCPLATPTILLGFLLPWTWVYLFMAALAKHSRCSLPWMRGISLLPPFLTFNLGRQCYTTARPLVPYSISGRYLCYSSNWMLHLHTW